MTTNKEKLILGLDLGTTSIGWALVKERIGLKKQSEIIKLGVRVNPLSVDEVKDFSTGKAQSTNAERTLGRGARRNLDRFQLRRKNLIEILIKNGIINKTSLLSEDGKDSTHETLKARAKAANEAISLEQFARVLLSINKKRGYKSSRKVKSGDAEKEGVLIDGMAIARHLYDNNLTPGEYVYELLDKDKSKYLPDFYRSDLKNEFDKIWKFQKQFYSTILTDKLYADLDGKNKSATWKICEVPFNIVGVKRTEKGAALKLENYRLRKIALTEQIDLEYLTIVLQEINNNLSKSSGYLGKISDRSKELYFKKETVGQNLYRQIEKDKHTSLKNQVFYRQDYLDEFEKIWETQSKHHNCLTLDLKEEIRDIVIFYQRKLKSQKHLISECRFEKNHKCIPKSSPLFQEYTIWQNLNNFELTDLESKEKIQLNEEQKAFLFSELNFFGNLKESEVLKRLGFKKFKTNFPNGLEGNSTNEVLNNTYKVILDNHGYGFDWQKKTAKEIKEELVAVFQELGINTSILDFDYSVKGNDFSKQKSYELWHLLYATEDDDKIKDEDKIKYGNTNVILKKTLHTKFGFSIDDASLICTVVFKNDYGSLSAKAIKKIMPNLIKGEEYSAACALVGYNHSNSLTKEEQEKRALKEFMLLLPKNSLRNPLVEKILNQMVNVVNEIITTYGKPDEVRIELARDLKQSAKQRKEDTQNIRKATDRNEQIRKLIHKEFGFTATKNDIIKYRLWKELESNGYKDVFTNTQIPVEKLFSKEIDIEHIIPKAKSYDDSYSNKTLAYKATNIQKGNRTGIDFITSDYLNNLDAYKERIKLLNKNNAISDAKLKKLLTTEAELNESFINRDLKNTQYIAKEAKARLLEVVRNVIATSGKITDVLRNDWGIINVMKELNLPKYKAVGLVEIEERKNNGKVEKIIDWSKRNDHRHHAMDALAVAFTTHSHVQYINYYNARKNEKHKFHATIQTIEQNITEKIDDKRRFIPPFDNFRAEAKKHIEEILISHKAKNKVVTKNINKYKVKGGIVEKTQLTPRGQLHKETVYKKAKKLMDNPVKLNAKFKLEQLDLIADSDKKDAVCNYLAKYNNSPKEAFSTKNSKKNPLIYKDETLKEVTCYEYIFTIRKSISPELKIDKILDEGVKKVLQSHLAKFGGDKKKAFGDIKEHPIWLNKEKGIQLKKVTITGVSNAIALHDKKDKDGNTIFGKEGNKVPSSYVSTGNNHHIAIYEDDKGNLQEQVVSFFEAVTRANLNLPIVDKGLNANIGWSFKFSLKQNEMFVFPNDDFEVDNIDLTDVKNQKMISKYLFRVQKITSKDYFFRHHLETNVETNKLLKDLNWIRINSCNGLKDIQKVRVNHIGRIVTIGEY